MTRPDDTEDPVIHATLVNNEAREASNQMACILLMISRAAVLDHVINAGPGDGLTAWRSLCRRFEPGGL